MRLIRLRRHQERGDTLIEVLIAITIASLILGSAYATTQHSLEATRDAEERGNALKLVESQIEQLKGVASVSPDSLFGPGVPASYCIASGVVRNSTAAECSVNSNGEPASIDPVYNITITRSTNTFTVRNTWASVLGTQNTAEMKYRLYR